MFSSADYLPDPVVARLTETRVTDPDHPLRAASRRVRRSGLTTDGKLALLAADHPARNVTKVGSNPLAMADRRRIVQDGWSIEQALASMPVIRGQATDALARVLCPAK